MVNEWVKLRHIEPPSGLKIHKNALVIRKKTWKIFSFTYFSKSNVNTKVPVADSIFICGHCSNSRTAYFCELVIIKVILPSSFGYCPRPMHSVSGICWCLQLLIVRTRPRPERVLKKPEPDFINSIRVHIYQVQHFKTNIKWKQHAVLSKLNQNLIRISDLLEFILSNKHDILFEFSGHNNE